MSKNIWVVIPVYNNVNTIETVVDECLKYHNHVLVIDDGSTDANLNKLLRGKNVKVIRHDINMGKGKAILTALDFLAKIKVDYMITIDGDGQHYPLDIVKFIDKLVYVEDVIFVGCRDFNADNVPNSSKFGRKFSNLWFYIETGLKCSDTQSGFRAYPVKYLKQLKLSGDYYDFETEVIARAVWAGLKVEDIKVDVHYPKAEDRVSSFKPFKDNFRISLMHMRLVGRRLLPWPNMRLVEQKEHFDASLLKHPKLFLKTLLQENASPMGLAAAAAVGTVLAVLPLIGLHTISILYVCIRWHLNKIMALAIQNLYAPPFVPFLCIELGYYLRHGKWLTEFEFSLSFFKDNVPLLFWDWFVGSLILAPFYALIAAVVVYNIAAKIQKDIDGKTENNTEKAW